MDNKIKEDIGAATAASVVPTNAMGQSSSTAGQGGVDTYDPHLFKKKLRRVIPGKQLLVDLKHGRLR